MFVHAAPVFDALPTSSDVHDRLSITYLVLVLHCCVWNDVMKVSDGGSNTLFEVDVHFLQILEYRVKLAGMNSSFRNLPVFLPSVERTSEDKHFSRLRCCLTTCSVVIAPCMWPRG